MVEFQFIVCRSEQLLSGLKWRGENFWSRGSFVVQFGDDLQSRRDFPRASGRLHAFASNVNWSIGQATSFTIGQRDFTGFGFIKLFLCREHYFKCQCLNVLNYVTKNTFIGNYTAPL